LDQQSRNGRLGKSQFAIVRQQTDANPLIGMQWVFSGSSCIHLHPIVVRLDETFSAVVGSFSKCHPKGSERHWVSLQMRGSIMLSSLHHHDFRPPAIDGVIYSTGKRPWCDSASRFGQVPPEGFHF